MIPDASLAAARSIRMVEVIGGVKVVRQGRRLYALCPFHDEKTPSCLIDDQHFFCFGCGAHGDAIEWVRRTRNLDFTQAVAYLTGGNSPAKAVPLLTPPARFPGPAVSRSDVACAIWAASGSIGGSAELYLWARGIGKDPPASLRYHPTLYEPETKTTHPALVAAVLSPEGELTAVQRIWLARSFVVDEASDNRLQGLVARKKTLGPCGTGAVRLAPAGPSLGLAEGVETGLACQRLYGMPVWCALGASRMHRVAIPAEVEQLYIFADSGEPGMYAATRAADANLRRAREVTIVTPRPPHQDFNDQLLGKAA